MAEHPILFSAPMVRAILDVRKTQTRRVVRFDTDNFAEAHVTLGDGHSGWGAYVSESEYPDEGSLFIPCPYGVPGDTLWVRETWRAEELPNGLDGVRYAADSAFVPIASTVEDADAWTEAYANGRHGDRWRPSIHMPRWASRLTLLVKSVRVERVQDITHEDAIAEGCRGTNWVASSPYFASPHTDDGELPQEEFQALWDSINAKRAPWESNPWVWVVEFDRVKKGGK